MCIKYNVTIVSYEIHPKNQKCLYLHPCVLCLLIVALCMCMIMGETHHGREWRVQKLNGSKNGWGLQYHKNAILFFVCLEVI